MKKKTDYIATILIILLGTAHTALTPVLAGKFGSDPVEFSAIGLAFIFLGFMNLSRIIGYNRLVSGLCLIANLLGIGWLCLGFIHQKSLALQGSIPFVVLIYLLIVSVIDVQKSKKTE